MSAPTDTTHTLVVRAQSLQDASARAADFAAIATANETFALNLDHPGLTELAEIDLTAATLASPYLSGTNDLLYFAVAKQLSEADKERIQEWGMDPDPAPIAIWRRFGFTEIADAHAAWQALADQIEIAIVDDDGAVYPDIANAAEIEAQVEAIRTAMAPHLDAATLSPDAVAQIIAETFALTGVSEADFDRHWVDRIIAAPGFAVFDPGPDDGSWSLANMPYGWLTRRHGAALAAKGYAYRFAFWAREVDHSRGHLWIATDREPLVLFDDTDAVSQRSHFPVRVNDLNGTHLFDLEESDVPDHLMADGPDVPPKLSARAPKPRGGFFSRLFGKR